MDPIAMVNAALRGRLDTAPAWPYLHPLARYAPPDRKPRFDVLIKHIDRPPVLLPAGAGEALYNLLFSSKPIDFDAIHDQVLYPWLEGIACDGASFSSRVGAWVADFALGDAELRALAHRGGLTGQQLCQVASVLSPSAAGAHRLVQALCRIHLQGSAIAEDA